MLEGVAREQGGVFSRVQALAWGQTSDLIAGHVAAGRWRRWHPGVYATHTGPLDPVGQIWAGLLYAGSPSVAGHGSALWLHGAVNAPPADVHVTVPHARKVLERPGLVVHRARQYEAVAQPAGHPPRARVEEAVLDVLDLADQEQAVVDLVLTVVQRRLTTAGRLRRALAGRRRHRWRALVVAIAAEAEAGVQSPLELDYLKLERRHGLPRGRRNEPEGGVGPGGRVGYRDVAYPLWRVTVELDGREAHPSAFRDRARDNRAALAGLTVLRYGWREVAGDPCGIADEVATVLGVNGWPGPFAPCPHCRGRKGGS